LSRMLRIVLAVAVLAATAVAQQKPKIEVIYPKPKQKIAAVDSMFIFGNVTPQSQLKINGSEIKVHDSGGFLAYLPVKSGPFVFRLEASLKGQTSSIELPIEVPKPYEAPEGKEPVIVKGYLSPESDIMLMEGDMFNTSFRGTSGMFAYFKLSTGSDLLQMTEAPPVQQSYWAEALWGSDDYPDSLLVRGVYTGAMILSGKQVADSNQIEYYLCRKKLKQLNSKEKAFKQQLVDCGCENRASEATLAVMPATKVMIGELTDSVQTIRVGPRKGYLTTYQPQGVRVRVTGRFNNHYRAQILPDIEGWVADSSLKVLPQGTQLPNGSVSLLRTRKVDRGVLVTFNVGAKLPFRVEEDVAVNRLYLDIYDCTSSIDFIRYDTSDSMISRIQWTQPQTGLLRLTIDLTQTLWGYDCYYEGIRFNLKLRTRPDLDDKLKGITFVIDPGHSPDPGAIGPTGYAEKDANLAIALELTKQLRDHKATVFMTREGDTPIALNERPKFAYQHSPDVYIAVHNNALPDGINPFYNNGSSTYYYEPHSHDLAEFVQARLVKATGLPDIGLYSGNFAVIRPTGYLAILVECAFMMIPEQETALKEPSFQRKIAGAIVNGVLDFVDTEVEKENCGN
jgi:N-acetylmuramoyl-L-alanine amidase